MDLMLPVTRMVHAFRCRHKKITAPALDRGAIGDVSPESEPGTRFRQGRFGDVSYIAGSLIPEPLGLGEKSTGDRNRTCTGYPT